MVVSKLRSHVLKYSSLTLACRLGTRLLVMEIDKVSNGSPSQARPGLTGQMRGFLLEVYPPRHRSSLAFNSPLRLAGLIFIPCPGAALVRVYTGVLSFLCIITLRCAR